MATSKTNKASAALPSFKLPPVVEVVMGVQFSHPTYLKSMDVADYWVSLPREAFPRTSELPVLDRIFEPGKNAIHISFGNIQMPRYWFESTDNTKLVQLQHDRLIYNWRRAHGAPPSSYPRYKNVKSDFRNYLSKYEATLQAKGLLYQKPDILDLSYVNVINMPEGGIRNIGEIFSFFDVRWENEKSLFSKDLLMNWRFDVPAITSSLMLQIMTFQDVYDGTERIKYELSVRGPAKAETEDALTVWYDAARAAIVQTFADTTTGKMHDLWERVS